MSAALWRLVPAGRCRQLLVIALSLASISAIVALVPALVIALIAAVLYDRFDPGLSVMQLVFVAIASVMARLGFLLLARNTAGSATELLTSRLRADAAAKIGALPLGVLAQSRPASFETLLLDDVETIGQFVSERLVDIAGAYAMLLVANAILFARDWRLASVVLGLELAIWGRRARWGRVLGRSARRPAYGAAKSGRGRLPIDPVAYARNVVAGTAGQRCSAISRGFVPARLSGATRGRRRA